MAAVVRAYSLKSRGARPSARCTPSVVSHVAPVEHLAEQERDELGLVARDAGFEHPGVEVVGRDAHEADLAAGGGRDLRGGLVEAQRARTGQLVDLALVAVLGQRGHRDVGDVLDVDERLGDVAHGQRDLARPDGVG